jgi:hypothetical protein
MVGCLPFGGHTRTMLPLNSFPASVPIVCEEFRLGPPFPDRTAAEAEN